jgi:hypothetical protein
VVLSKLSLGSWNPVLLSDLVKKTVGVQLQRPRGEKKRVIRGGRDGTRNAEEVLGGGGKKSVTEV